MARDLSASFLKITDDIAEFYEGMREYWSTRTLMEGYSEAAQDITQLVEEATHASNPLIQSCAGSGLAVAKMLGAIPIGIDHWVIETARSTVHQGLGAGFKTLIGTPIEGFIEGGKFVLRQGQKWMNGEISSSTFGVADEVATTLGTAALMFLGIKAVHTGGTGMINSLKNIELPTPYSFASNTGYVMPIVLGAETFAGIEPMTAGLVLMGATKSPPNHTAGKGKDQLEQTFSLDVVSHLDVETVAKMHAVPEYRVWVLVRKIRGGDAQAIQVLLDLAVNGDEFSRKTVEDVLGRSSFKRPLRRQLLEGVFKAKDSSFQSLDSQALDSILDELSSHYPEFESELVYFQNTLPKKPE